MRLLELRLSGFRNLVPQTVTFSSRVTAIVGRNGQGKTSLLEAIFFLAHTKSFRTSRIRELISWKNQDKNKSLCDIQGTIAHTDGSLELRCCIEEGKKKAFINATRVSKLSRYYGHLACLSFTPEHLTLVKGPPSIRRGFIDSVISLYDPHYLDQLINYTRALKNRNALLASRNTSIGTSIEDSLAPWNTLLSSSAVIIAQRRNAFVEKLSPLFSNYYDRFCEQYPTSSNNLEKVSMEYRCDVGKSPAVISEEEVVGVFNGQIQRDIALGRTSRGIQKDLFPILLDCGAGFKDARVIASQGQARSIALSLLFASLELLRTETGELPLLLLDDVGSELDSYRLLALYKLLLHSDIQVIFSTTEVSDEMHVLSRDMEILQVEYGRLLGQSVVQ